MLMFVKSKDWAVCFLLLAWTFFLFYQCTVLILVLVQVQVLAVGAYFNIPFAWLLKQKIPIKEQTPQAGFVFQWVFSVSKAMQLWTVAVWLVQCQAVSFRKIRDDQFFEEKSCRKTLAETRTQELLKCSRISFRKVLISRKFKVCLWHGFLCHF